MSESQEALGDSAIAATTAGGLLRAARQAQGLHIATLATMLKVSPRKLEALESDQYGDLQGVTFVRALAQAACRALKLDPAPILAKLPRPDQEGLGQVRGGLNAPFRERGMKREPSESWFAHRGLLATVAVLMLAALAMWGLPRDSWSQLRALVGSATPAVADAGSPSEAVPVEAMPPAGSGATASSMVVSAAPASAVAPVAPVAAAPASSAMPAAVVASVAPIAVETSDGGSSLQFHTREASWIEVVDGGGKVLLGRTLTPGESLAVNGVAPFRVKIGNVRGTELTLRGQAVDLLAQAKDNVARLELR